MGFFTGLFIGIAIGAGIVLGSLRVKRYMREQISEDRL
jgi:uncharacterized protein YneF (UPF0154 family)